MAGAAPTIGRVAAGRAQATAPLTGPQGAPPEVELARVPVEPAQQGYCRRDLGGRDLGITGDEVCKFERLSGGRCGRRCPFQATLSLLSPLPGSHLRTRTKTCQQPATTSSLSLVTPKLILILNPTHNFPNLFV